MARNESIISVFVASPSDVSDERKALDSVISELNQTWSKSLNLRLELIKWETDVFPGFGEYAQDVINQQINDEYDVFIAIFWGKVGSPTKVAESGTLEELERAYLKYKNDNSSVDLLVYFKDQAIAPSKMDFVQLQKLEAVKKQLGEKGGLYWMFERTEDFENILRGHLSKVAQKWSQKLSKDVSTQNLNVIHCVDESDDEFGFLDYIEIYTDRMADMTSALSSMTEATEKVGVQFNRRTEEVNSLVAGANGAVDSRVARKIITMACDDLDRFSDVIDYQVKVYAEARSEAFDALSKAIPISIEISPDNDSFSGLEEKLSFIVDNTKSTKDSLILFRDTLVNLPKLTLQMNKSKRNAVKSLDRFLDEVQRTMQSASDVLMIFEQVAYNS